jgi:predicted RNA-binding Zn ribbon-like protein
VHSSGRDEILGTACSDRDLGVFLAVFVPAARGARRTAAAACPGAPEGLRWRLGSASGVQDGLSVIAADAIGIIAGERDGKLALCASPTCRATFFDTSRSRTRTWRDMNTCGNRRKKARFHADQRKNPGPAT